VDDIDGHVLISRMKDLSSELVVLALSAGNQETTLVSAMIAGARDVIAKPLQAGRVIDTVKRLLKERHSIGVPQMRLPDRVNPSKKKLREEWTVL